MTAYGEESNGWQERLYRWRKKHFSDRQVLLAVSFLVGIFAAFAACLLHWFINVIQHLLTARFDVRTYNWLYLVFPVVGIYLTSLFVKYVVKDDISHGVTSM